MVDLADSGMTMLVVTHEMGFASQVADQIIFMDEGQIVEQNTPSEFFDNPQSDRTDFFRARSLATNLYTYLVPFIWSQTVSLLPRHRRLRIAPKVWDLQMRRDFLGP